MNDVIPSAGDASDSNSEPESQTGGAAAIPGAVSPDKVSTTPDRNTGLNQRLAAFRERRAAQAAAGGGAQGGMPDAGPGGAGPRAAGPRGAGLRGRRGPGGGGGGPGRRGRMGGRGEDPKADEDPVAAGRKVLDQLSSRLSEAGEEGGQRLQFAVRNITRGYDALEAEVKRLKEELAQARGQ